MAGRHPLHNGQPAGGDLAPAYGVSCTPLLPQQLLPYERQLIQELGCTEQEYLQFKQRIDWLSRERPAEYAHIPDVQNDALTVAIISLVLGVVSQGLSLLLAPRAPAQQRQGGNRTLDSIAGRDRFAPTYGFQANQELSRYGETIPIVFTKQQRVQLNINGRTDFYYVGGIMISPKLVWSRMFSWGGYQSLSMVFLAGQSPMPRGPYSTPAEIAADRAGVYIGQLPLDSFPDGDYRWYYYQGGTPIAGTTTYQALPGSVRTTPDSRLRGHNNRYGNFGTPIGPDENAFNAQTFAGLTADAFCHSFSPSSRTQFGAYNGLPNGTPYRLNWDVVSYLSGASEQTAGSYTAKRFQIAGNPKMAGVGRNYARQFGIVSANVNGTDYTSPQQSNGLRVQMVVGGTVTVIYNAGRLQDTLYYDTSNPNIVANRQRGLDFTYANPDLDAVDNKQIISAIQTEHEQQDELLKIGTKWMIGNCMFEVSSRTPSDNVYDKTDSSPYTIILKCIAVYGDGGPGYIGVCHRPFITTNTNLPEGSEGPLFDIGQAWFPICKAELATFQNSRACEVTEIGIKSNVWTRFNGITNFNSVPSVEKLHKYDTENTSLSTGTNQSYARRASFFHLYVRPANNDYSPEEGWAKLNPFPFCVVGSAPQDQYNFIRIAQPFDQFEYRIRPVTSGEINQIIGRGLCIRLNSDGITAVNPFYDASGIVTQYGTFTIRVRGFLDDIAALALHSEMVSDPVFSGSQVTTAPVSSVRFVRAFSYRDNTDANLRRISNGIAKAIGKDPDNVGEAPFPDVPYFPLPVGAEYQFTEADKNNFQFSGGGRTVRLNMRLRVENLGPNDPGAARTIFWTLVNGQSIPANFTGTWTGGEIFVITKPILDDTLVDYIFEVNTPVTTRTYTTVSGPRIFEINSAIAEVSHYSNLITRSCDNGPEHELVYVNENLANDPVRNGVASYTGCAMAGISVRSGISLSSFEQLHIYQKKGIQVTNIRRNSNGNTVLTTDSSNIFTDLAYYLLTNPHTGAGELISSDLVDLAQFARTGSFLEANGLYYDDVIVEPQNLREFLARISTSLLCNLVMRGGKFSIEPALPIDTTRNYTMFDVKVPISGIFTEGNIIEDSFQLEYVQAQERLPIRAMVRYRTELPNRFPQEQTAVVYYTDQANGPLEEFNFTHITSRYHAELFAKYALSARRHRTHVVSFQTLPYGLGLAPGDFIRVVTQASYVQPGASGIIKDNGAIITPAQLTNGQSVEVYYWDRNDNEVNEDTLTISIVDGQPKANKLFGSIFAIKDTTTRSLVYMVDSIDLDEEGLARISASYFPIDANGYSVVANELKPSYNGFTVVSDLAPD